MRPLSWSSTISSVAVRTPDFCPGDLRLVPNGTPVTTHERIGSPKRCPKTKSKKAAKAIKTGINFPKLLQRSNKRRPYGDLRLGYNGCGAELRGLVCSAAMTS